MLCWWCRAISIAQLDRWVDQYFAGICPAGPIPRVTVAEPARTAAVSRTAYDANVPLPAVLISYHIPPERSADARRGAERDPVGGESSRLYETLVYRDQLAQSAATFLDTKQSTGNLVAYAMMASGKPVAEGEAALARSPACATSPSARPNWPRRRTNC
jgi:zinc protease